MIKIKEICEQLQSTNGKKDKEKILIENKSNKEFKDILYFLLNPFITTGISTAKINKNVSLSENHMSFIQILDYIKENNTGTDVVLSKIHSFLNTQPDDMQEFLKSIITKSLKLGCNSTTVNKVYGKGFIPKFDVMLGTSIEKCKLVEGDEIFISHKLNGSRCLYYKGDLYTRSGRKYTGVNHIIKELKRLLINPNIVVDGELIRKNIDNKSDSENFQIGIGIANSNAETKEELKLVIFDIITVDDFQKGISKLTYKDRLFELDALEEIINNIGFKNLDVVKRFYRGTDHSQIWKWLDYAEEKDLEGVIINLDKPYQCKRTKDLIKVKKFKECDILCTGIENGTNRLSDTLGNIICDYKGFECRVGSGFTDKQRELYYNNPSEIVGKIITVKYKEETSNKNGGVSIQFPVFQCVRFDKTKPSYN